MKIYLLLCAFFFSHFAFAMHNNKKAQKDSIKYTFVPYGENGRKKRKDCPENLISHFRFPTIKTQQPKKNLSYLHISGNLQVDNTAIVGEDKTQEIYKIDNENNPFYNMDINDIVKYLGYEDFKEGELPSLLPLSSNSD